MRSKVGSMPGSRKICRECSRPSRWHWSVTHRTKLLPAGRLGKIRPEERYSNMKTTIQKLARILLLTLPLTAGAAGNNWMSSLNSGLYLSQFSIAGTHETMARYEPATGTAKCQNLTLADQLNAGVRFIDIRCRHYNNAFVIHHGSVYQNANFDDVLNACTSFLQANPSECIILSVKDEYTPSGNTRTF